MNLQNELRSEYARLVARRWFLRDCGVGLASVALSSLLGKSFASAALTRATDALAPRTPHFSPKAKRVIYLFMGALRASSNSSTTSQPS